MTDDQRKFIKQAQKEYEASYGHCGKPIGKGWVCRRKAGHAQGCSVGLESGFKTWLRNGKQHV